LTACDKIITDKFSNINIRQVDQIWTEQVPQLPRDYFASNFPFVRRIRLMAAAGGLEQRDLFKNPLDHANLTGCEFSRRVEISD
jgi:hypothetical protein